MTSKSNQWKLLPFEPTEAMFQAANCDNPCINEQGQCYDERDIYRAMWAAAPKLSKMNFEEYDKFVTETAVFPDKYEVVYPLIGLVDEAGECAGKIKKWLRGDYTLESIKEDLKLELGDVLWYTSALALSLGYTLQEVLDANVEKLSKRRREGTLKGDGDHR